MKLIHLPMLSLVLATGAHAADLSPGKIGPITDPARGLSQNSLQVGEYNLGLGLAESSQSIVDPDSQDKVSQRLIQRELHLAVGLPLHTEMGLLVENTQERTSPDQAQGYDAADHSSKPLGGKLWLRWNMLHNSWLQASVSLQYQPGMARAASSYQASQDRSTVGMDLKIQPFTLVQGAVYASYSRRHNEHYQTILLGQEKLLGARLALGTSNFGTFADTSSRYLSSTDLMHENPQTLFAREFRAGLYAGSANYQFSAFAWIPDTNRYIGVPERGFGASMSVRVGGESKASARSEKSKDALTVMAKADRKADRKAEAKSLPPEPQTKVLETVEPDEFQLLEERSKQNAIRDKIETPAEKAERELLKGLEIDKKIEAQKALEQQKAKRLEADQLRRQIRQDDERYQEYKDDVNQEINQYTLPDQTELNWNGLTPR